MIEHGLLIRLIDALEENAASNRVLIEVLGMSDTEARKMIQRAKREAKERKSALDERRAKGRAALESLGMSAEEFREKILEPKGRRRRSLAEATGAGISVR